MVLENVQEKNQTASFMFQTHYYVRKEHSATTEIAAKPKAFTAAILPNSPPVQIPFA